MTRGEGGWSGGQSTLEYILIITAVLVAVGAGARVLIQPAVTQTLDDSKTVIQDTVANLRGKFGF